MERRREVHSADGRRWIGPVSDGWGVWFDAPDSVATRPTRDAARSLIRALKADPALAEVLAVQES